MLWVPKMMFYAQFVCYLLEEVILKFLLIVSYHGQGSIKGSIYMSQFHHERGWVTRNSLVTLPPAFVGSDKGWQSLPPGTPALTAGTIGLMVTKTTEFEKKPKVGSEEDTK